MSLFKDLINKLKEKGASSPEEAPRPIDMSVSEESPNALSEVISRDIVALATVPLSAQPSNIESTNLEPITLISSASTQPEIVSLARGIQSYRTSSTAYYYGGGDLSSYSYVDTGLQARITKLEEQIKLLLADKLEADTKFNTEKLIDQRTISLDE